jgi:hypothetical protein
MGSGRGNAAFYCVSDDRFFLGAVGLINSLRLQGHAEPIFVLDCGLTPAQRELLAPEVTIVPGPTDTPPYLLKTIAPLRHPAEVMVLIDADMIATLPLAELIEQASGGRVVAFRNDRDRFVPAWGELLDLGPVRRRPYVSVGLVFLGGSVGAEVLRLMDDRQRSVDFELTWYGKRVPDYPFLYPEQDVLNAILCTRVEGDRIATLDHRLAATPPYRGLRLLDRSALRCRYGDGTEPYVLHQFVRKPWLEPMYHGIYPRLLARLLLRKDVAIRVPNDDVPLRMRDGMRGRMHRWVVNVLDLGRWYLRERLPRWIAERADVLRSGRTGGA